MKPAERALDGFREVVAAADAQIDLARAALEIARHAYPEIDPAHYLAELDRLADGLAPVFRDTLPPVMQVQTLSRYLFRENGFHPAQNAYYDPRNSYLNEVLDRREGIPISLSLVYLEVGMRLGLPLAGISFPQRFLVKHVSPAGEIIIDPFGEGRMLDDDALIALLVEDGENESQSEFDPETLPDLLRACSKRDLLLRWLRNLKGIYFHQHLYGKALEISTMIFALTPDLPIEIRDRGVIYEQMECARAALADYERYLLVSHDIDDHTEIRQRVANLKHSVARLN